ncbi:unnamed protein product, partial [Polarella glacialis]
SAAAALQDCRVSGAPRGAFGEKISRMTLNHRQIHWEDRQTVGQISDLLLMGFYDTISELLRSGKVSLLNSATLTALMRRCAASGGRGLEAVEWVLLELLMCGPPPAVSVFNVALNLFAQAQELNKARTIWKAMESHGVLPNKITYNTMVKACVAAADPSEAEKWLLHMCQAGVKPCLVSFTTLINGYSKVGQKEKAEECFELMQEFGIAPDVQLYNSMIDACAKAKDWQRAEHWLCSMQAEAVARGNKTLVPDLRSFNCVINACAQAAQGQRAEYWLQQLVLAGLCPDVISYGSVMHAIARDCKPRMERAEYWMQEMMANRIMPNLRCFNTILAAALATGAPALVRLWLDRASGLGLYSTQITYQDLFQYYLKAHDLAAAKELRNSTEGSHFAPWAEEWNQARRHSEPEVGTGGVFARIRSSAGQRMPGKSLRNTAWQAEPWCTSTTSRSTTSSSITSATITLEDTSLVLKSGAPDGIIRLWL